MNRNNGFKGWGLSLQKQLIFTNGRDKGWDVPAETIYLHNPFIPVMQGVYLYAS